MNNMERKLLEIFVNDNEKEIYERFDLSFFQKLEYCFSKHFREDLENLIVNYDFQMEIYEKNKRIFEEVETSVDMILGEIPIQEIIEGRVTTTKKLRKRTPESYRNRLNSLMKTNQFYNDWNLERSIYYQKGNCKRLMLEVASRFKRGDNYIVMLKTKGNTSLSSIESQIPAILESRDKGIILENKIYCGDYYIGLELDGIVFKKGCPWMEIYEVLKDGFAELPFTKLAIESY